MCTRLLPDDTLPDAPDVIETRGALVTFLGGDPSRPEVRQLVFRRSDVYDPADAESCLCGVDVPATARRAGYQATEDGYGDYRLHLPAACP